MKLSLQGVTILFASGDDDAADVSPCMGLDSAFNPNSPACPYVTLVGATAFPVGSSPDDPEISYFPSFESEGRFSNLYAIPSYQENAVNSYFTNHDLGIPSYSILNDTTLLESLPNGKYNRIDRGFPDISAVGLNYPAFVGGIFYSTKGGTSIATPIIASIFTLINEKRLAAGKSPVGFVNPTLYANPQIFNDITVGNQSFVPQCRTNGFSCVPGWDPVTGIGTPKYEAWLEVFMALP